MNQKAKINIELVAKQCGLKIVNCGSEWGGKYGYTLNNGGTTICGFKTKEKAIRSWWSDQFSSKLGKVLLKHYLEVVVNPPQPNK